MFCRGKDLSSRLKLQVAELVEMNMLVAVAQSPGQGESPFGSSPHTGHCFSLRPAGEWGKDALTAPFPPSRSHSFAPMYHYTFEIVYLS